MGQLHFWQGQAEAVSHRLRSHGVVEMPLTKQSGHELSQLHAGALARLTLSWPACVCQYHLIIRWLVLRATFEALQSYMCFRSTFLFLQSLI